jgi:hypothetical protein
VKRCEFTTPITVDGLRLAIASAQAVLLRKPTVMFVGHDLSDRYLFRYLTRVTGTGNAGWVVYPELADYLVPCGSGQLDWDRGYRGTLLGMDLYSDLTANTWSPIQPGSFYLAC